MSFSFELDGNSKDRAAGIHFLGDSGFPSPLRGFNLLRFQVLKVSSRVFPTSDSDSSSSISIAMQFSVFGWIDHVLWGLPGYAIYQLL